MTKIKNTKKGMAKKTLSMSLVVAMLATSNVPVWAAEFSDDSDVAVTSETDTAPVVTDDAAAEFTDNTADAAPVADDTETVAAQATEETSDEYIFSDVKLEDGATNFCWNNVTDIKSLLKSGSYIRNSKGNTIEKVEYDQNKNLAYAIRYDGEWSGSTTVLDFNGTSYSEIDLSDSNISISQDTLKANAGKKFEILILEKDDKGDYSKLVKTISFGTIKKVSLSDVFNIASYKPADITYNGTELKVAPAVAYKTTVPTGFDADVKKVKFKWNYSTTGDYVNAGSKVTVVGKLENPVEGYEDTLTEQAYTIKKKELSSADVIVKLKTPGKDFAYGTTTIDKSEVDVFLKDYSTANAGKNVASAISLNDLVKEVSLDQNVAAGNTSKVNVTFDTKAIKASANFTEGGTLTGVNSTANADDTAKADNKTTVDVVALNLADCTVKIKNPVAKDSNNSNIEKAVKIVVEKDGKEIELGNNLKVTLANGDYTQSKTYYGVVTVAGDGKNVIGTKTLDLVVIDQAFGKDCNFEGNEHWTLLTKFPDKVIDTGRTGLPYNNGKEVTIDAKVLKRFSPDGKNYTSDQSNFKITYSNNVNATTNDGTAATVAKLTVTAVAGDYAGCSQDFYFAINPSEVYPINDKDKTTVTSTVAKDAKGVALNEANDNNAAGYADALGLKVNGTSDKAKKPTDKGVIISNATTDDYTVKYSYVSVIDNSNPDDDTVGDNKVDQYVKAEITLKKDGNFAITSGQSTLTNLGDSTGAVRYKTVAKTAENNGKVVVYAKIADKSIDTLDISLKNDTFTFTGEVIKPEVVVKNGSKTLKADQYKVTVDNGINAGTADIKVEVTGYTGTKELHATINPADINNVKFEIKKGSKDKFTYNGESHKPKIAREADTANKITEITEADAEADVKLADVVLSKMFDITYGKNVDAGEEAGTVTLTPKALYAKNFKGSSVTATFEIKKAVLKGTIQGSGTTSAFKTLKLKDATGKVVTINTVTYHNGGTTYYTYEAADKLAWTGKEVTFASAEVVDGTVKVDKPKGSSLKPTEDDYEIKYLNNVDKTTDSEPAYVCVVGKGNFTGAYSAVKDEDGDVSIAETEYIKEYIKENPNCGLEILFDGILEDSIVEFQITGKTFGAKNVTVANATYAGGLTVKPVVTVKDPTTGATLVEGTDYELLFDAKKVDATTKPIDLTVKGIGQYNGTYIYKTADGKDLTFTINKKDLKDCSVSVDKNLKATVLNGNVLEAKENFDVKDNGDGTATVSVVDGGKNYTGSVNVEIGGRKVGAPMISNVKVVGNKATVILSDDVEGASGYDYVISTDKDCITNKDYAAVNKNQAKTTTAFKYVDKGTYYAYCHAWTRDANGKKVFGEWSNGFQFSVTATTPDAPVITDVKVSGSTIKVTYRPAANATGYDVVLGTSSKKDNGELRPYNYGAHKKLNLKEGTVTATFKNVPKGTWTVGMHAFNRTSIDNKKVFSPWSNLETAKVK